MITTGLNDNQNIVLDYLKNGDSPSPFINIHVFWADYFNYRLNSQVTDIQAEVFEAYSGLDNQEKYEVLQEYGRWGINGFQIQKQPVWVVKDDDMYLMSLAVLYDGDRVNSYFHVLDDNFDRPRVFRNKEEAEAARILAAKGTVEEWSEDND